LKWDRREIGTWLSAQGKRYRYVLLVLAVGLVLLKWPESTERQTQSVQVEEATVTDEQLLDLDQLERRLEEALEEIRGVGRATVILTLRSSSQQIYATEGESTVDAEGGSSETTNVARISTGSGTEEALQVMELAPTFQGALVVCDGGENSAVKLAVTQSVAALTGLGSDCISVCGRDGS
jgi:stage III sporulation protein AG